MIDSYERTFYVLKDEESGEYVDFNVRGFSTTDCLLDATRFRNKEQALERVVTMDSYVGYTAVPILYKESAEEV